jgi:hypothetical protein
VNADADEGKSLLVMLGLPESGKTTFLAALWHLVSSSGGTFELDHLAGDQSYLNRISHDWLRCEPTTRTSRAQETEVAMFLRGDDQHSLELRVPDISGESYNDFWEHRGWPAEFDNLVTRANGLLLFVHPGHLHQPEFLDELGAVAEAEEDGKEEDGADAAVTWSLQHAADQVKLVELLQFAAERREEQAIPLAVVVSAWDLVVEAASEEEPATWFAERVPLLGQYLESNASTFPRLTYGVSAQGGDFERHRKELLAVDPTKRVKVVDGHTGTTGNDLTLPLNWLTEQKK